MGSKGKNTGSSELVQPCVHFPFVAMGGQRPAQPAAGADSAFGAAAQPLSVSRLCPVIRQQKEGILWLTVYQPG